MYNILLKKNEKLKNMKEHVFLSTNLKINLRKKKEFEGYTSEDNQKNNPAVFSKKYFEIIT